MFADVLPPPTFCIDWYILEWPNGLVAFMAVSASLIAMFAVLARRGSPKRNILLLLSCLALFIVADMVVYFVGINLPRPPRPRPPRLEKKADDFDRKRESPGSPNE